MSTMKIGWGTRIAMLYGGFVLIISALVTGSMRQDFDLVSKDYYQEELKYQEVIEAGKNQSVLSSPVAITATADVVHIVFPKEMDGKVNKGEVHFYSQVNAAWDKEIPLAGSHNSIVVPRHILYKTNYMVKIRWQADGKEYYQESKIDLSK